MKRDLIVNLYREMRIGKKLLLMLCASSLCAGVAYGQAPTLGPGEGNDAYYPSPSNDGYQRVDKITTDPNIVYMTLGQKSTFWVVANYAENPTVDHNNVNLTGLAAKWKWEFHDAVNTGTKFEFANSYTGGTVTAGLNKMTIQTKAPAAVGDEAIVMVTEEGTCTGGASSNFKIMLTGKPSLKITAATVDGTINGVEKDVATGMGIHTQIENSKGFEIETCDAATVQGKTLAITVASVEQGAPAALQKYAFSIKESEYRHTKGVTTQVAPTNVSDKINHTTAVGGMAAVATGGTTFNITLPTPITLAPTEDYVDYVYYLSNSLNSTDPAKQGVVSAISQRSEIVTPGIAPNYADHTFYPYTKTDGYYVRVRVKATPATGPVYFIPYIN